MLPNPPCRAPRGGASHVPFLSYRYALSRILSSENGQNREFLTRFVNAIWANWHNGHLDRLSNLRAKDIRFRHNVSPDQSTLVVLLKTSTETSRGKTTLAVCRQFFCCVTSRRAVDQSRISVSKQRFLFLRTKRRQLELAWSRWFLLEFRRQRGVAPFGNPDPNAGLRTGFGFNRGGFSGNFGLTLNQGSSRSSVTTAPSVTTTNGIPGTISDQTLRPFVTSVTPVVGGGVLLPQSQQTNETQQFLQSYQHAQNTHVQQRRIANANVKQERAYTDFERGLKAEKEGNLKMARANYRNALGAAQGPLRIEILKRMRARGW